MWPITNSSAAQAERNPVDGHLSNKIPLSKKANKNIKTTPCLCMPDDKYELTVKKAVEVT